MYSKQDFMKDLYSELPNEFYDSEAVNECINLLYDAFDKMSYMLTPTDQDAIEKAVARIIYFHLPSKNADGIAKQIEENIRKWGEVIEER